jgi:hypothetical protein
MAKLILLVSSFGACFFMALLGFALLIRFSYTDFNANDPTSYAYSNMGYPASTLRYQATFFLIGCLTSFAASISKNLMVLVLSAGILASLFLSLFVMSFESLDDIRLSLAHKGSGSGLWDSVHVEMFLAGFILGFLSNGLAFLLAIYDFFVHLRTLEEDFRGVFSFGADLQSLFRIAATFFISVSALTGVVVYSNSHEATDTTNSGRLYYDSITTITTFMFLVGVIARIPEIVTCACTLCAIFAVPGLSQLLALIDASPPGSSVSALAISGWTLQWISSVAMIVTCSIFSPIACEPVAHHPETAPLLSNPSFQQTLTPPLPPGQIISSNPESMY